MEISEVIKRFVSGNERDPLYKEAKDAYDHLRFHFDSHKHDFWNPQDINPYFHRLIFCRRPGEPNYIKDYRSQIYLTKTRKPIGKVITSLKKIVKSPDWLIDWKNVEYPASIPDKDFELYISKGYPFFRSLEAQVYTYLLEKMLVDANGVVWVMPVTRYVPENEFLSPSAYFVHSNNVFWMDQENCIFLSEEKKVVQQKDSWREVPVFVFIDKNKIVKLWHNGEGYSTDVWEHNHNELYAFRIGGKVKKMNGSSVLFASFLDMMLEGLDTAAREVSDLDADVVRTMYTTMWYYGGQECHKCNGTGKVGNGKVCGSCNGEGILPRSPYVDIKVKAEMGENLPPTPPAGFVNKDTKIIEIQDKRIDKHIFDALSSINMEFLAATPLNESGKAKEIDKSETNAYIYEVAYALVDRVMYNITRMVAMQRYWTVMNGDKKEIMKLLPDMRIPEKFDVFSSNYLLDEIKSAKDSEIDPHVISNIELEYVEKRFEGQEKIRDKVALSIKLNPFPGKTTDELLNMAMAGVVKKEDIAMSLYMPSLIDRAMSEDKDFLDKEREEQLSILSSFSREKIPDVTRSIIDEIDESEQVDDIE